MAGLCHSPTEPWAMFSEIVPVWTVRKASQLTQMISEEVLLNLYEEEFFVEERVLVEDNAVDDGFAVVALPDDCTQDIQHICRANLAQTTTLLFDITVPDDSN
jgi:hypothetical protein